METMTKVLIGLGVVAGALGTAGLVEHYSAKPTATPTPTPTKPATSPCPKGLVLNPAWLVAQALGNTQGISMCLDPTVAPGLGGGGGPPAPTPNTTDVYLAPGVMTAPQVGPEGSTVNLHVPATGGTLASSAIVDGVDAATPTGGTSVSVKTTRNSGTILISFTPAGSLSPQLVTVNYGTPPKSGIPQTVQFQGAGQTLRVSGAGVPGSLIVMAPPDATTTLKSPYTIDGVDVDFQEGPGANVSVQTTHWSGLVSVKFADAQGNLQTSNLLYGP